MIGLLDFGSMYCICPRDPLGNLRKKTILNVVHSLRGRGVDFFLGPPRLKAILEMFFFGLGLWQFL